MSDTLPFEVVTEPGGRAMLAFVTDAGAFAWPWHALKCLRLSAGADVLVFDYTAHSVEVTGRHLGDLADLACATRVKLIRVGRSGDLVVNRIRLLGDEIPAA